MSEAVTAGRSLRAPFPWFGDALAFALECVRGGLLRVDPDGSVWRVAVLRAGTAHAVTPRRAESAGAKGYLRIVLGVSGLIEGSVLALAVRAILTERGDMGFLRYVRERADPATVAILLEDGAGKAFPNMRMKPRFRASAVSPVS